MLSGDHTIIKIRGTELVESIKDITKSSDIYLVFIYHVGAI